MIPLRQRSDFQALCELKIDPAFSLANETPLFAAERDFAWQFGGPITRAFLAALPVSNQTIVVDSSLVWLRPGLAHGFELGPSHLIKPRSPLTFIHEPFPGIATGVRGVSNRNRNVRHWTCYFGLPCTPEVLVGDFEFSTQEAAEVFWLPIESLDQRNMEIEKRLAGKSLQVIALLLATLIETGWGSLVRGRPAEISGFQFALRATDGDSRPRVNGLRNYSII